MATGKASPQASCSGASRDSSHVDAGPKTCGESVPEPEDSSPVLTCILGYFWSLPGESVLVSSRGMHVRLPPSCISSVELPFARIKGSVAFPRGFPTTLSHDTFPPGFPRGFPTVMSHMPPWCQSILSLKVEAVPGKQASLECTETSGGSRNGGTTLEFLSPFLWRAPPLEM